MEETIVSTVQRVKQSDGTYVAVFPVTTVNEVYYDLENKVLVKDVIDDLIEDTAPKYTTINGVSTFRDAYSYKPDGSVKSGSMVLRTPFSVKENNSNLSLSVDMTISGNNNINLSVINDGKIKSRTKLEDATGNSQTIYSASSKLGTHLALTTYIESRNKYNTTVYSIYRDTLTELPLTISSYFTVMAFSEDGTVFAGRTSDNKVIVYYKDINGVYSLVHTLQPTLADIKFMHITEPTRLTNTGTRQFMLYLGNNTATPEIYNVTSSQATKTSSFIDGLSGKTAAMDSSEDGRILVVITHAAQLYKYNESQNKYIKLAGSGMALSRTDVLRVNHKGDRFGVIFGKDLMSVTVNDTTIVSQESVFNSGNNVIYDFIYTREGGVIISLDNASYDYTLHKAADFSIYPSNKLKGLMNSASKIQLSSYGNCGFFVKAYGTTTSYPAIIPVEFHEDVKPTTSNPINIVAHDISGISEDGNCVAISPVLDGPIRIYKRVDDTFVNATIETASTITDTLDISASYNGNYVGVVTNKKCYVYKNNGANIYNEFIIHGASATTSDPATWTEPRITFVDNGSKVYIIISDYSKRTNMCYDITNISSPVSISTTNVSTGVITGSNELLIYTNKNNNSVNEIEIQSDGIKVLSTIATGVNPDKNCTKVKSNTTVLFIDNRTTTGNAPELVTLCVRGDSGWQTKQIVSLDGVSSVYNYKLTISDDGRFIFAAPPNDAYIYVYHTYNLGSETLKRINTFECQSVLTDLNVTPNGIIAHSSVYPYIHLIDVQEVEGSINVSFDGNIVKNNLGILSLKDYKVSHDNSEFISDIGVCFDKSGNGEIGFAIISRNITDWSSNTVHVNKVTVYNEIENINVDTDLYNYSVEYVDLNNTTDWTYPTFIENSKNRYKDMQIEGSATLNGDRIVTITKVPNITVTTNNWWSEVVESGTIYRYRIHDHRITVDSIVNIDINDIHSIDVASEASLYGSTVEGDGYVDIFAVSIPTDTIMVTLNIYK